MGVESKIRELLEGKVKSESVEVLEEGAANRPLDNSSNGDATNPLQGNSNPNPDQQDLSGSANPEGGLTSAVGKEASAKAGSAPRPSNSGAGKAPNYNDSTPTQSVVAQASSKGNVAQEEVESEDEALEEDTYVDGEEIVDGEESEDEVITEDEESDEEVVAEDVITDESDEDLEVDTLFEEDIANLFADEEHLSEEFKTQAASLFEATVVARVNQQVSGIEAELVEEANKAFDEAKEKLVENIDKYLSYVTEQWMAENELAIENGLRNEITESFIQGLQQVFTEHYIDVPEDKLDVLTNQQQEIEELKSKLDEEINKSVAISEDREQLLKQTIFSSVVDDLAETEVEKFASLIEDITFDSKEMYTRKLNVIKENYFPKAKADDSEKLEDSVDQGTLTENTVMSRYVQGITQSKKFGS